MVLGYSSLSIPSATPPPQQSLCVWVPRPFPALASAPATILRQAHNVKEVQKALLSNIRSHVLCKCPQEQSPEHVIPQAAIERRWGHMSMCKDILMYMTVFHGSFIATC